MTTIELQDRINKLAKELEQAFAVYNKLLGHLSEAKFMLEEELKDEQRLNDALKSV